jgi:hypothetical protein
MAYWFHPSEATNDVVKTAISISPDTFLFMLFNTPYPKIVYLAIFEIALYVYSLVETWN